jgi:DeoR/GlpR family transcriptional regulator of sugar metabolism
MQTGQMTRGDYVEITGVSPVTASRDLAYLVEKGMLKAQGMTRNRVYLAQTAETAETGKEQPEGLRLFP